MGIPLASVNLLCGACANTVPGNEITNSASKIILMILTIPPRVAESGSNPLLHNGVIDHEVSASKRSCDSIGCRQYTAPSYGDRQQVIRQFGLPTSQFTGVYRLEADKFVTKVDVSWN